MILVQHFYFSLVPILDIFRYRIHQSSAKYNKSWYRCVCRQSNKCRATVVLDIQNNEIIKITRLHTHGASFLANIAWYVYFNNM